mmetsp:Transcript_19934/g.25802  ORF Transcript_19934/g.25802 Transcript_19934/m.25802 type:complete len:277 (-) Transcript_19934:208-1038(-)
MKVQRMLNPPVFLFLIVFISLPIHQRAFASAGAKSNYVDIVEAAPLHTEDNVVELASVKTTTNQTVGNEKELKDIASQGSLQMVARPRPYMQAVLQTAPATLQEAKTLISPNKIWSAETSVRVPPYPSENEKDILKPKQNVDQSSIFSISIGVQESQLAKGTQVHKERLVSFSDTVEDDSTDSFNEEQLAIDSDQIISEAILDDDPYDANGNTARKYTFDIPVGPIMLMALAMTILIIVQRARIHDSLRKQYEELDGSSGGSMDSYNVAYSGFTLA